LNAPVHTTPATLRTRVSGASRGLLALGLLGGWLIIMRRQGWVEESGGGIFSLGFLLVAGTVGGSVAAIFKLPRLTGYLAVGVISGPYVLELFTVNDVKSLTLINGLALALIALQAGAELTIPMLKRSLRSLSWASLTHSVFITGGMTLLFAGCALFLDFTQGLSWAAIFAVGGVWGAMAVSKAPADTLAILGETGAKGPLPEHALGVVVVLDVVVLVLFAIAMMVAKSMLIPGEELSISVLEHLGVELIASVAAGTTFGLVIAFYFWAIGRERLLFTVAAAYGITAFCAYFHYDTLLVFVVAGFVVMNLTREGHTLVETTESVGSAVMVVFFATAGAQLDVGAMAVYGPIALVLAGGRIFLTFVACRTGHRLAEDHPVVRKYAWTSFISQAGVTIGLGTIAANALGDVGTGIATLIIAVIGINEVIGPVAFKIALGKAAVDMARLGHEEEEQKEEESDELEAITVQPEVLRATLSEAFDALDLTYELKDGVSEVHAYLLLGAGETAAEGTIDVVGLPSGKCTAELSGRLLGVVPHDFVLKPKKGVAGLIGRIGDLKTGEAPLDEAFVIEAPDTARPLIRRLGPSFLPLLGGRPEISAQRTHLRIKMRLPGPADPQTVEQLRALVAAWQAVSTAASDRRKPKRAGGA
jgi:Kef-type K+ transport system membrane component KefB